MFNDNKIAVLVCYEYDVFDLKYSMAFLFLPTKENSNKINLEIQYPKYIESLNGLKRCVQSIHHRFNDIHKSRIETWCAEYNHMRWINERQTKVNENQAYVI